MNYTRPATHDLVDGNGLASCSPISGSTFTVGTHTVICSATDSHGNHAMDTTFTVTVLLANTAPVANPDSSVTDPNQSVSGNVLANDTDADGNPLTAVQVSAPAHGTVVLNPNGAFVYTPAEGYSGTDTFTYRANDGTVSGNTATVTVTIRTVGQVAAEVRSVLTAVDSGLGNDVDKIISGNPKNNCKDAIKLQDKIAKDKKYTAAQKTAMIAAVARLARAIGCP